MKQKKTKTTSTLIMAIMILTALTAYLAITRYINQPINNIADTSKNMQWKNFSFNGNAISFKYPTKWCWNNTDCRNLYVTKDGDNISIGQLQKKSSTNGEFIEPILSIYYVGVPNQASAEKYLKDKYKLSSVISWTTDKNNSAVKVANLKNSRVYGAYSKELGILVSFNLQPACLLDCKIDNNILSSIKLDGVQIYRE